jgi:CheY-like chemotaxis protein
MENDVKKTILIVEDSVDFANLLQFLIEDEGVHAVQFPVDGGDIIEWVKMHKPVTILMDLALRRKAGLSYIDDLKADPVAKNIPIIIITGRDLSQKEILEFEMQDVKYLRKGRVEINDIKKVIRETAGIKVPSTSTKR